MKLVSKMLEQQGIKPKGETTDNGGNDSQEGGAGAGSGAPGGDGSGGTGSAAAPAVGGGSQTNADNPGGAGGGSAAASEGAISNEAILAALKERGIEVANLDELKPKPAPESADEIQARETKRRNEMTSWALTTGKVKTDELSNYAVESKMSTVDLAFANYKRTKLAELTAANTPTDQLPSEQTLRAEFDDANFLNLDENDSRRKIAEKRLQAENDEYLQEKYPAIYNMEDEYTEHFEETQTRSSYQATVTEAMTGFDTSRTFTVKDDDKDISYPVRFSDTEINEAKDIILGENMYKILGRSKASKEAVAEAIYNTLVGKNLGRIISDVANAHASAKMDAAAKGRREIFNTTGGGSGGEKKKTSPGVAKILGKQQPAVN